MPKLTPFVYTCRKATQETKGERKPPEEIDAVLAQRRAAWKPKPRRYKRGTLRLFSEHAASPMKGAYLEFEAE